MNEYDVIVVGGGASGLLCGGFAAKYGAKVLITEKMKRPARKILVTGKGRCNLTNNCQQNTFIKNVKTNPRFLYSAYAGFTAQDTMAFFEDQGVPLVTQRGDRVFPKSESAMDIADAMVRFARQSGARIAQHEVEYLLFDSGVLIGVKTTGGEKLMAKKVVIATGGMSYPGTGSTGDGYKLAKQVGHTVTSLRASLIPLEIEESFCRVLMGLSLRNVELYLYERGKKKPIYNELGEMLFTHFGISGPLVLSASAYMKKPVGNYSIKIDLKPGLTYEMLDNRLLRDFNDSGTKHYGNYLEELLPRKLIGVVVELSGIKSYTQLNQITKEQREILMDILKGFTMTPIALRPIEEAVITAGGVAVGEIDPKTMESKWMKGLYFVGEVLDLDAFTGGFNLQIAFSTGHAAGKAIGEGGAL